MITKITPRMQKAFTDGKRPFYAADIWLSVNNGLIDTQADFQASLASSQVDFTTKPGFARLAIQQGAFDIDQVSSSTTFDGGVYTAPWVFSIVYGVQKIQITPGRSLTSITVKVNNTGATGDCTIELYNQDPFTTVQDVPSLLRYSPSSAYIIWKAKLTGLLLSQKQSVAAAYDGEVDFSFDPVDLPEGDYWLVVSMQNGTIYYNASDVYPAGSLSTLSAYTIGTSDSVGIVNTWVRDIGDLYFRLELSGYYASGTFTSKIMALGEKPIHPGTFQMAYDLPSGTKLRVTLAGSDSLDMTAGTIYADIQDGQEIAPYENWQTTSALYTDASLYQTPIIDMQEVLFPKDRLRVREKVKLSHVTDGFEKNYQSILNPLEFTTSEINLIDRVSTGGSASAVLEDRTGEVIQRIISDSPLKNHRVQLYMGADVPGFAETDLLRFFIGSVQAATYKPGYQGNPYQLPLTFKNPVLELKRKVPQPTQTGLLDFEVLAINYDGWHVIDAIIDLIRGKAGIPGRYVNLSTLSAAKSTIGDADLPASAFLVRRSNALSNYTPRWARESVGDGTVEDITKGASITIGNYVLLCTTATPGAAVFSVKDPSGTALANATEGVAYTSTHLNFTIASGTVEFAVNDKITISNISPDTRIKTATEAVEILKALATIADGYITADESSRIAFVKHDFTATAEAEWADEDLVRAGMNAVPIFTMESCDLGYDKYLYNTVMCACEWDGTGDKWENFTRPFIDAQSNSINRFGQGEDTYISIMEKNMREPSKWLGPEAGYNGETIAQWLANKLAARFAFPPVVITGAVLPLSQFMRTQGSVVTIWSKRFTKLGRRGIAASETKKFMVLSKKLNGDRSRCVFNLVELT